MSDPIGSSERTAPAVRRWLFSLWALIFAMVLVGGITRLTGSGLSIVHWQPVSGVIPPLNEADWQAAFESYKTSPQFREVNRWMSVGDFQRIFWWEYIHRLLGRAIGLLALVPWLYFVWRKAISRSLALKTAGLILLGAAQGFMGWYMVQSGLVDEPRVSHFRLAAHLSLAFLSGMLALWLALDCAGERVPSERIAPVSLRAVWALVFLLALQVVYGAFMAGTHAGYYYATFPDLNGSYLPGPSFTGPSALHDALHAPTAIHYVHRLLGFVVLGYGIGLWVFLRRVELRPRLSRASAIVALLTFLQFNLGAFTVVRRVEFSLALAHQVFAYVLLSSVVLLLHRAQGSAPRST